MLLLSLNTPGGTSTNTGAGFWLGQTVSSMVIWVKEFEEIVKEIKESKG